MKLKLEDFTPKIINKEQYYLRAYYDKFEITLEPHIEAGFSVGIYDTKNMPLIAIEKRAIWRLNHPTGKTPDNINRIILDIAIKYANQLLTKHLTQ